MANQTIFDRLDKLDRRVYYWLIVIVIAWPLISPIGLPITVKPSSRALYDGLLSVQDGDIVLIDIFMSVSTWPECMGGLVVETNTLIDRGARLIYIGNSVDVSRSWERLNELVPRLGTLEYGTDVAFLGYYTGADAAASQMAVDMSSIFPADHFGTPIDDLPLMRDANSATDYAMVLFTAEGEVKWIQQWGEPYGVPVAGMGIAMKGSALAPYLASGDIFGLAVGVRGAAELEKLADMPAAATTTMDAISSTHLLFVILIVLANLPIIYNKIKGGS
ncbi:hypothetical protein D4R47_01745 [archaeon]|nr:MAG: hypothetical protein D4R47_01745 [archaeon]